MDHYFYASTFELHLGEAETPFLCRRQTIFISTYCVDHNFYTTTFESRLGEAETLFLCRRQTIFTSIYCVDHIFYATTSEPRLGEAETLSFCRRQTFLPPRIALTTSPILQISNHTLTNTRSYFLLLLFY